MAITNGEDGGTITFQNVSLPVFHAGAVPNVGEPSYSAIAFVANGGKTYLLLGDSAGGVTAYNVGPKNSAVVPTALAVGPGRFVGGIPCASVIGFAPGSTFLSGPDSCRNGEQAQLFSDGGFSSGLALGGLTSGSDPQNPETGGTNLIAFGNVATLCPDSSFPLCDPADAGVGPHGSPALPDVGNNDVRILDPLLLPGGNTHWLMTTNAANASSITKASTTIDLATGSLFGSTTSDPRPPNSPLVLKASGSAPQIYVSTFIYLYSSTQEFQFNALTPVSPDGASAHPSWSSQRTIWSTAITGAPGAVDDPTTLHTLMIDQATPSNTTSTLRSAWIAVDGIYTFDFTIDVSNADNSLEIYQEPPPVLDGCPTSTAGAKFTFVAPLSATQLFTVDSTGAARVHHYSADGGI